MVKLFFKHTWVMASNQKIILILLFVPSLIYSQIININEDIANVKYSKSIIKEDLYKHVEVLSSDSLEGRETGRKGQRMAAEYIANHFRAIGIPPYKDNTYYQKFMVKSKRHNCKCSTCDDGILKRIVFGNILKGENVLGYIEGTDLRDELLIITAHYDHLGKHDTVIYNGADDDASGTAAVLEIAEAFMLAKNEGKGPRRSVLVMPVSGEEKGLLGSKYYTDNPIFPLEKTIANLNIDMIGRIDEEHDNGNYVYLIGSDRLSNELHTISENVNNKYFNINLDYTYNKEDDPNRYYYRSDHYNFANKNIPVIFYFNGVHKDYHKSSDTIEKLDFDKTQKITRLIFLTAWELANREERPALNKLN